MKLLHFAGLASVCLLAACTSACAPFTGISAGGGASANQVMGSLADTVKAINSSCTGTFSTNLTFAPPLPPVGNLNINQTCGVKQPTSADTPAPAPAPVSAPK